MAPFLFEWIGEQMEALRRLATAVFERPGLKTHMGPIINLSEVRSQSCWPCSQQAEFEERNTRW